MGMRILRGDITEIEADALVNPANTALRMGGGVAGALRRKGGREIEEEAVAQGPIEIGQAVATTAGRLRAKWVIHAPTMALDFRTDLEKVALATRAALRKAQELGARSVALPAMGTGVGGLDPREVARVMLRAIEEEAGPLEVILVLYDKKTYEAFREAAGERE